jgi:serine/threonine-protein kinase RsbT
MQMISNELAGFASGPDPSADEVSTEIQSEHDVLRARRVGRSRATLLGFRGPEVSLVAAAISEVARNIVEHAGGGHVIVRVVRQGGRRGLMVIARDQGPGIPDPEAVSQYGSSGLESQGVGLPGAKLLMDEFDIVSGAGRGTTVTMTKWISP